ncbi:MAG TPA: nitrate- and nitrite sensing domain-containing protein [Streptosporangiaceae bacterium]|nr:nitrate- and nitrite sensing domain-containing protein [Streptosporangiaceae bacterium]
MRWRLRSVRTRILLLVLVPVISLIGIYVFAIGSTARDAVNLARANSVKNAVGDPIAAFMNQLSNERLLAIVYMASPSGANLAKLNVQVTKTNAAASDLHSALTASSTVADASPAEKQAIAALVRGTASLPSLRSQVSAQIISSSRAFGEYNAIVQQSYRVLSAAIREQNNAQVVAQALAFVRMGQSGDRLAQENTLLVAGQTSQHFTPGNLQTFTQLVGARRALYNLTLPDLDPQYRAYYTRAVSPRQYLALLSLENTVVSGTQPGAVPAIPPLAWQQSVGEVGTGLQTASQQAANALTSQANSQATGAYLRLILVGGLGLVAIAVSIALGLWIGRRLVRELSSLRQTALELANERLPDVVSRLAAGEEVDASAQAPPITATSDEVRQVGEAFATVQQTAVEAAVGQAKLRQGISHIFRNLARRSQSLLHRQLTLLDAMERRARDPQELDDLFRVDHLATRMRRHAESLIILSGEAPARGWRNPVPLVDVLRAAVAEVEDYTRIKVSATTQASLAGPAVGDVIHMIAELAENATIYSPPQTPVLITGSVVGQGFAVEIEDRGLGMSTAHRDEINAQLENPPAFDLSGSDQLGLFVAGQLAKRQNIRISLRSSAYGGTTAIVLIPRSLVVPEGAAAKDATPLPAGSSPQIRAARHAIASGHELPGPDDRPLGPPDESQPEPPASPIPVAVTGLRGEWGPALDWPETTPGGSAESTDYRPEGTDYRSESTDYRSEGTDYRSESTDYGPLGYPDTGTVGRPTEFSPLHTDGGNGPGSVIPATAEEAAEADLDDGLPRRVRQASLAPQLRDTPARPGPSADLGVLAEPPPTEWSAAERERSPEETRVTMSAIQRGWERGRSVFDPAGGNGEGTPEPGPGTGGPDDMDAAPGADAVASVDVGPVDAGEGAPGQAADTGITADSAASWTDAGGAGASTHRTED